MATGGNTSSCSSMEQMNGVKEEDIVSLKSNNLEDLLFDETIGHIQDIIIDDRFSELQQKFMDKHYHNFEDIEENKFIYTDIHQQYVELIEKHIETELTLRVPGFNMQHFMITLESRKNEVPEEIFDILLSFTEFLTFKQMFLDYKAEKDGTSLNLDGLLISSPAGTNR